jgi:hypothetical protein
VFCFIKSLLVMPRLFQNIHRRSRRCYGAKTRQNQNQRWLDTKRPLYDCHNRQGTQSDGNRYQRIATSFSSVLTFARTRLARMQKAPRLQLLQYLSDMIFVLEATPSHLHPILTAAKALRAEFGSDVRYDLQCTSSGFLGPKAA